jgi:hypothetical protein
MFPLTPELIDFLLDEPAQRVMVEFTRADLSQQAELRTLTALRQRFSPDQAAALLDQARLRERARGKFPLVDRLLFVDDALQQASSRAVAVYRAQQMVAFLSEQGSKRRWQVADLGCGIGADTIALAEAGLQVLAVERDPIRARIAQVNVAALDLAGRVEVLCADWTTLRFDVEAVFVDPSRRSGEQRIFRLASMEPPFSAVLALVEQTPAVAVKTMPGIADEDIPSNAEVEFISERGAMKEALLRFGGLRTGASRRATLLPGPFQLDSNLPIGDVPTGEPLAFLFEPDPAILRATLVQHLAMQLGAAQLDPTIAYLTIDRPVETPFGKAWRVLRHGPFHLKTLNHWLREMNAGEVVVKKRGTAIDPDEFRRRLKTTPGGQPLTVFLTRVQARPWMIVTGEP